MVRFTIPLLWISLVTTAGICHDLEGLWRVEERVSFGSKQEPNFKFIRFEEEKVFVSNGADWAEGWVDVEEDSLRLVGGWPLVWEDAVYCAVYNPARISEEGDNVKITTVPLSEATGSQYELTLSKIGDDEKAQLSFDTRSAEQSEAVAQLSKLGVSFTFDELGFVTAANLETAAIDGKTVGLLLLLPKLSSIEIGRSKDIELENLATAFDQTVNDLKESGKSFFWESAAGESYRNGRISMAETAPLPTARGSVFFVHHADASAAAPAIIVPFRGKSYVVHRRYAANQLPESMVNAALTGPVPIAKVVVDRLGFQIRAMNATPPEQYVYEPFPKEKLALYDGRKLKVLGVGGSVTAYMGVLVRNGQDWIAPEVPYDWGQVKLCLLNNPDESMAMWSGCPVIDEETGYLVGMTSRYKEEGDTKIFELETIWEIFRAELAPITPNDSFLGVKKTSPAMLNRFAGIIPGAVLNWRVGTTDIAEEILQNPAFLGSSHTIPLGRQYLFSEVLPQKLRDGKLGIVQFKGQRIRIDDPRLGTYLTTMLSLLGTPAQVYSSEGRGVGMKWQTGPENFVHTYVNLDPNFNVAYTGLQISSKEDTGFIFGLEEITSGDARKELDDFMDVLSKRDPEPRSFIVGSEKSRLEIESLLKKTLERLLEN